MTPHFPIYMDYGATTPVDPRVVDAMIPWLRLPPLARHPRAPPPGRHGRGGPGRIVQGAPDADDTVSTALFEVRAAGLYRELWQSFAVLLPVRTVGVMGDSRSYDYALALRAVTSTDGMTADIYPFDAAFLSRVATRIINEVQPADPPTPVTAANTRSRTGTPSAPIRRSSFCAGFCLSRQGRKCSRPWPSNAPGPVIATRRAPRV